jgi:pimeloyl-ACP methyl ester carboxylesterase
MAEDTLRAVKAIGLKDVNIMGVSLGGMIALTMELIDPDAVHSMMLCSTAAHAEDPSVLETWKKYAEERNLSALMESFGEYVYSPSFYEQYKDLIIASGEGASEQDFENFITSIEGIVSFDCRDRLKDIHCPSLVIGASEDRILGVQSSYDLAGQLKAESFIYEGYGHAAYDEAPDYLTHIKGFLDQVTE